MDSIEKVDILIVDDRMDGIIALEAVLDLPHINLVRASSGREALGNMDLYDFAVILLDVQMPEMDGFETAQAIRKNLRHKNTPIIFVTAINKDDMYIYKGYQVGAVDYIFKPFEPQILRSKVNTFVDLFIKSRQLSAQNDMIRESERRDRYLKLAELEVESLKRYRNLADAIPHIVWKARIDGTVDYFNKVWTDYTGLCSEKSIGSHWQTLIHPDDLKGFLKSWIKSMNNFQPFEAECRVRRKDGEMRWFWMQASPEVRRENEIVAWLGTGTDIHDRKQSEEKLIEAEKVAVSANLAKSHFLANMSHEIRTPLNAILGFAELILNPAQTETERIYSVATIRRSGHQLLKIIDEILDISKVEAGRLEIETVQVNLIALLSQLKSLLNVQALSKNLQLQFIFETPIPELIFTDPTRLRQILLNIIGNAIKFTSKGSVVIRCHWQKSELSQPGQSKEGTLSFRICDTGVGIEAVQAEKLFKPFTQVDSSTTRKFGGTGLGLALSRQFAAAMNGNVTLESSKPNKGSTFLCEIKTQCAEDSKMEASLIEKSLEQSRPFSDKDNQILAGIKILVVDDAPDNQVLISRFLKSAGAEVDVAGNGVEGVEMAMAGDHKIILMDIQMPQLDGYEATASLRNQGYKPPIIALTAHAFKEERDRCISVGCTDHLTKPVDRRVLIDQVARLVKMPVTEVLI